MKLQIVIVVVVSLMHEVRSQTVTSCSNSVNRTAELTIVSYRDKAGRWVAQVDMEHGEDDLEASPWKVDLQHNTVGCPGSPRVKVTAKLIPPPLKPSPGYELHKGQGYYKFHTTKKTWLEAKAVCESEGAHLAIINSEAESQILKDLLNQVHENATGHWAFVGFHDLYREGQFLTIFDEPLKSTGFLRWSSSGQPDNAGGSATNPGEDCGSIHRNNGGLNDIGCSARLTFFCESAL